MTQITHQIVLDAGPEAVFGLLTDLDRLPEWATIVVDTREVSERPLRPDCTFRQTIRVLGRELDSEWQITELEPGRHIAYEANAPLGGSLAMKQTVVPHGTGSRVQLEIDYELPGGFVGELLDRATLATQNEREVERSLQNLKELLDG